MGISLPEVLVQKIRDLTGLRVNEFDREGLAEWVKDRSNHLGLKDAQAYLAYLERADSLSDDRYMLSHLLTTGETFFMRDPGQMELIRSVIFPDIIAKRAQDKHFRIWAPACATGEEVYSLIILLDELLPQYEGWTIDVIGSDIDPGFISQAKAAVYKEWAFRGCDDAFRNAYFQRVADGWKLKDHIRSRARFLTLDLMVAKLPDFVNKLFDVDFILCRNLFIYMNQDAITTISDELAQCLAFNGVLMTGHGELHAYSKGGLQAKIYPQSLVYQKIHSMESSPSPVAVKLDSDRIDHVKVSSGFNTRPTPTLEPASPKPLESIDQLFSAAWYFADRSEFAEALKMYGLIRSKDPMLADLHYLHAVISMESGDVEQAKIDLRKALYLDAHFIPAYLDLIAIQIQEDKNALALKTCEQALEAVDHCDSEISIPHLKNTGLADLRAYLMHLKNGLTLNNEGSTLRA